MRFIVPLSSPEDLLPLHDAGADEVYFGILDKKWRTCYGGHDSINRRQGVANLSQRDEMHRLGSASRALSIPVSLALNARITPEQIPYILDLCEEWFSAGGHGVIVRDIFLIQHLQKASLPLKVTASLLTLTVNSDGVQFLKSLGVSRIVLPRFLTLCEMGEIAKACPEMEFEAMIFGDKCPMIDGLCHSYHGESFQTGEIHAFHEHDMQEYTCFDLTGYAHHLCAQLPREEDPCAACYMRQLENMGIENGKIGGRGMPLTERLRVLRFFNIIRRGAEEREIQRMYKRIFSHSCNCYY